MLRMEFNALDGTKKQAILSLVHEKIFTIKKLAPGGGNRHSVFLTHPREVISYHYERDPADPRTTHAVTLEVDAFGNVLKSATIGYGRRQPDVSLLQPDQDKQKQTLITYTENRVTNAIEASNDHRAPLPAEARNYELTGMTLPPGRMRFTLDELITVGTGAVPIQYEE